MRQQTLASLSVAAVVALFATLLLAGSAAAAGGMSHHATLRGAAEVPGPGDPDGLGTAEIKLDATAGTICYQIKVVKVATPTAAHIHAGAAGQSGAPVVTLSAPAPRKAKGCVAADAALIAAIHANPAGYYVNVHTADFPGGAIRGQLR